ncbi:hypothetical protein A7P95_01635 [Eikenella longinqua]|uniref:Uncharacterized protein n=1 Tax=Eikenella longinqua TaxID=1795827 RepID=A0A1A9S1B0_9NEIS|nr:hypothetical protein A7P95_01635 [Eikenella longinqua]
MQGINIWIIGEYGLIFMVADNANADIRINSFDFAKRKRTDDIIANFPILPQKNYACYGVRVQFGNMDIR